MFLSVRGLRTGCEVKGIKIQLLVISSELYELPNNKAIEAKIVAREKNPFIEYKLSHFNTKTIKRALSKNDILKIINADCTNQNKLRQLTHNSCSFSYLCGRISLVDIANLTRQNIVGMPMIELINASQLTILRL